MPSSNKADCLKKKLFFEEMMKKAKEEKKEEPKEPEKTKLMDYYTMLATRRPTVMQKILDRVDNLPYSVPRRGLPAWKNIPLDRALPYIRVPENTICFTKGKMGARLYPQPPGAPFNNCPSPAPEYDAVYDPNLRAWLRRQTVRYDPPCRPLEPPCSQSHYTKHRRLLQRVWSKLAFLEIQRQDAEDRDTYIMRKIEGIRERQRYNALKAKIRNEQMMKVLEQREEEARLKQEDVLARQHRVEMRIIRCREMKEERRRERVRKAREKAEKLRQKSEAGKEIARMKLVKTLKNMRITDNRVKRQLQANIDNRAKRMREEDERRWEELWKSQIERHKLKSDTMKAYTENINKKVAEDLKSKKHAKDWKDELLRSMQLANLKQFSDVEKKYVRGIKKQLVKRWKAKLPHEYYQLMRKPEPNPPDALVTEAVHSGINGRSPSMTSLERADYWLNKWEEVPKQVRDALNTILGRVVVQITKPSVINVLNEVKARAIKMLNRKITQTERAAARGSNPDVPNPNQPSKRKCIPRSPSQQELHHDLEKEKNAPNEMERSLAALRRVLTDVIRDHVYKGFDLPLMEITTLPRTVERQSELAVVALQLAVYVSDTRGKDIKTSDIVVRKTAEDMLREVFRVIKEEKSSQAY